MAATREEVFERVKEVLVEQLGIDESEINDEASFQDDLDADSLDLVVARELCERYPVFSEGRLAKMRSHVVSRASCAVVGRELGLGVRLLEAEASVTPDELARLSHNRNVLAALLEAALAALFLEH